MALILKSNRSLILIGSRILPSTIRSFATHWDPKYRKLRAQKVVKPKLPEFERIMFGNKNETKEEERARRIKEGFEPPVGFEYKPINFTSSTEIFDPYIPPENDGKSSNLLGKTKDLFSLAQKKITAKMSAKSKIKSKVSSFTEESFLEQAKEIYNDAHTALMKRDSDRLLEFVTEHAYSKMWNTMKYKTLKWKLVEYIEKPTISHMVQREMSDSSEIFAQITVRFHSKQILAIFDRFGRLALGNEELPKDVLEYVIFERYLTNVYSSWRMHEKIEPIWLPPKQEVIRTFAMPKLFKVDESVEKPESKFKKEDPVSEESEQKSLPSEKSA